MRARMLVATAAVASALLSGCGDAPTEPGPGLEPAAEPANPGFRQLLSDPWLAEQLELSDPGLLKALEARSGDDAALTGWLGARLARPDRLDPEDEIALSVIHLHLLATQLPPEAFQAPAERDHEEEETTR